MIHGFMIPGLAMAASELPDVPGVERLENPEIGSGQTWSAQYTLEDVAAHHIQTIERLNPAEPLTLLGMSMGGMVLAIMASTMRRLLPPRTSFHFLVTTPNLESDPAVPDGLLKKWSRARPGNDKDFERILRPFLSSAFLDAAPDQAQAYFRYRARGGNRQSARAFYRQLNALRGCQAHAYFEQIDPEEATFTGGGDDRVLGPAHNRQLQRLCPGARHQELPALGHMVNIERPYLFERIFRED